MRAIGTSRVPLLGDQKKQTIDGSGTWNMTGRLPVVLPETVGATWAFRMAPSGVRAEPKILDILGLSTTHVPTGKPARRASSVFFPRRVFMASIPQR